MEVNNTCSSKKRITKISLTFTERLSGGQNKLDIVFHSWFLKRLLSVRGWFANGFDWGGFVVYLKPVIIYLKVLLYKL